MCKKVSTHRNFLQKYLPLEKIWNLKCVGPCHGRCLRIADVTVMVIVWDIFSKQPVSVLLSAMVQITKKFQLLMRKEKSS